MPAPPEPQQPIRFHGFDALRGGAMLLGIVLHAAITYMDRRMDGLLWPLDDQPTSYGFDVLFWWIHGWRIPLFFVMAGFFAAMLARRRGPSGFIKHRVDRILIPVAIASALLLPMMYYIWGWGWMIEGRANGEEVWQFDFADPAIEDHFMGPAHLWFLNYLVVFSFVYWAILKLRGAEPGGDEPAMPKPMRGVFRSAMRPLWFALPTFVFLAIDPGFYLGYHHVIPLTLGAWGHELAQMVYQGYFFAVGIYLFRMHRAMEVLKKFAWVYLVLAQVVLLLGALSVGVIGIKSDDPAQMFNPANRFQVAATVSLFCWLMIWGMTGLGLTILAKPRAWVRWLSDSAYWVYLVHLPMVALLLIVMRNWPIGPWPRFLLIVAAVSAATLVSYQTLVRYTFIGRLLNGPRTRPTPTAGDGSAGR